MPSRIDLHRLAMRTLEDALAETEALRGPVQRTLAHRLALAWLAHAGVAEEWQCKKFWQMLGDPMKWNDRPNQIEYIRGTNLRGCLGNWYARLGWPIPDPEQRYRFMLDKLPLVDTDGVTENLGGMCNLYRLHTPAASIADLFGATASEGQNAASEVYPGYKGLVVTGGRVRAMTWGFPVVLKGKNGQPLKPKPVNNARFDKLGGFWKRWASDPGHRCLIPVNAYAEAAGERGHMTRTWLSVRDAPVMAWAGLWRTSDEWGDCYTGVMTDNAPELRHIHDRSPVLLEPGEWDAWLTAPFAALSAFDRPFPAERVVVDATSEPWARSRS